MKESNPSNKIVVSGTFTTEPIEPFLNFWLSALNLNYQITFSSYNQIFQELLNPTSLLHENKNGINLLLIRFEDWQHYKLIEQSEFDLKELEEHINDFKAALISYLQARPKSVYIIFCKPSFSIFENKKYKERLIQYENEIINEFKNHHELHMFPSSSILDLYTIDDDYEDEETNRLAHIPYKPIFFSAIATFFIREISKLERQSYKVIAVDCDNTLWKGVCGEVGALGVEITPDFKFLQEFLVQQAKIGRLICLCSKNEEKDVFSVFDKNPNMILKREHLAGWRINWQEKSKNLHELAQELQLGMDSFIFLDDNPIECAEVNAYAPSVLSLELPSSHEKIPHFLKHTWVFDAGFVTEEDKKRTALYQQNLQREQLRRNTVNFSDFIANLNLKVDISYLRPNDLERVSQLTQRTNQFNATTIRRTTAEINDFLSKPKHYCLIVDVSDRFGDYGLVGVIMFFIQEKNLIIDTLLLSCRVLGRGVEYQMLSEVGKIATNEHCEWVELTYMYTPKNQPVRDFLLKIGKDFSEKINDGIHFKLPNKHAETIFFDTATFIQNENGPVSELNDKSLPIKGHFNYYLGVNYADPARIVALLNSEKQVHLDKDRTIVEAKNETERILVKIWRDLLNIEKISTDDAFLDLGGHSIAGVQMLSEAKRCGLDLKLQDISQSSTIATLSEIINKRKITVAHQPGINKYIKSTCIPLSYLQFEYWISELFYASEEVANILLRIKLRYAVDVNLLTKAVESLINENEIFSYRISAYFPLQYQQSKTEFSILERDLTALAQDKIEDELVNSANNLLRDKFWLTAKGKPLIKLVLFRIDKEIFELQICTPHIITDELSMKIIAEKLFDYYNNYANNTISKQDTKALPYKDFIFNERNQLSNDNFKKLTSFWEEYLDGASAYFQLPKHAVIENKEANKMYIDTIDLDEKLLENLYCYCSNNKINISDALCAAIGLSIIAYSDTDTTPEKKIKTIQLLRSIRNMGEYDSTIGLFVTNDVIKIDMHDTPDYTTLIKRINKDRRDAESKQFIPLFLKMAACNSKKIKEDKKIVNFLMRMLIGGVTKLLPSLELSPDVLMMLGYLGISIEKRKEYFMVFLNIKNKLFLLNQYENTKISNIDPSDIKYCEPIVSIRNLIIITLTRNDFGVANLYISAYIKSDIRKKILEDIVAILKKLIKA